MIRKTFLSLTMAAAAMAVFSVAALAQISGDYCRNVTVEGPPGNVRVPEKMTFTGSVSGGGLDKITLNWTVSNGTIVSGQGTPIIQVELEHPTSGQTTVTATLQVVDPNQMMQCATTATETGVFLDLDRPTARLGDEFRTAGNNCEEGFAHLDNFFLTLANDPNASGVIIVYTDESDSRSGRKRKKQLMSHMALRKFEPSRMTFLDGPLRKNAQTQFWLVPPGAEPPQPEPGPMPVFYGEPKPTDPYLYGAEYADGIPGCGGVGYDVELYARELATTKTRGRVIISETSQTKFTRKRSEISAILTKNRVPASRVTFVFKKIRPRQLAESTELWVIPAARCPS